MIIRSQDKKIIANFNSIDTIDVRDKQVRYFANGGVETMGLLGIYSTEEKAIEVLDRISKKYSRYQCLKACGRLCEEDAIFQIPSDEEVEV